jgi:hypothetical protein
MKGKRPDAFEVLAVLAAVAILVILGFACYWGWL